MAVAAKPVEGAALDQGLDHLLVDGPQVHVLAEVKQTLEPPDALAGLDHVLDGFFAHALDRRQPEANHALIALAGLLVQRREIDVAVVDVGRHDLDAHPLAFGDVLDDLLRVAHFVGQQGRHELDGIVRLQIGRLVGDERIARRVALIEAIAGEPLDQFENLLGLVLLQALGDAAGEEPLFLLLNDGDLLLADGLDERVCVAQRDVAQPVANTHNLLLIYHNSVGLLEDLGHDRVGQGPFGAVLAVDVVRDQGHRAGAVEGVGGDQVLDAVRLHLHQQVLHAAGFELEHALGLAVDEDLEGLGLGDVELFQVELHAVVLLDQLAGPLQDAERLEAQEVHLQQAHLLDNRPFVLGDDVLGARGLVERHEVRQRLIGDDHAGGVHRGVAGQPFELAAHVDHLADQVVGIVRLLELGLGLQGLVERHVEREGHQLGEPVRFRQRDRQDAADVPNDGLGFHRSERDDLRDLAVLLPHVVDDVLPAGLAHVDIDIGHLVAGRVHEPLEQQVVPQRVHVAQAQAIADDRADAAAPGPHGNVVRAGVIAEVPDDQEVAGKALGLNHLEFAVEPLFDRGRHLAIAPLDAFQTQALRDSPRASSRRAAVNRGA